jgi:manganese/zinc/iron transport system permease protein
VIEAADGVLRANTALALAGCTLFGAVAGVVGTFVLARRRALLADVAAHASLPGVCVAFLVGEAAGVGGRTPWLLLAGGSLSALLATWCVPQLARLRGVGPDGALAVSLSFFFGLGAVLLSVIQSHGSGSQGGLNHLLFGSAAATTRADVAMLAALAATVLVAVGAVFKELAAIAFDEQHARVLGIPVRSIDLALLALLVACVVAGMQVAGIVLVVAMIVAPAATARLIPGSLAAVTAFAAVIGAACAACGVLLSMRFESLPTGSAMTLCAGGGFMLATLLSSMRRWRGARVAPAAVARARPAP